MAISNIPLINKNRFIVHLHRFFYGFTGVLCIRGPSSLTSFPLNYIFYFSAWTTLRPNLLINKTYMASSSKKPATFGHCSPSTWPNRPNTVLHTALYTCQLHNNCFKVFFPIKDIATYRLNLPRGLFI